MLADISGLIGLIVFVVIAIIASLLKRKEEPFELPPELKPRRDQPPQASPPPHAQRPPPPIKRSWEEELRALLEDRPAPPPIRPQTSAPVPPPIIRPKVRTFEVQEEDEGGVPPGYVLRESEKRYAEASHIQERIASRLADVTRHRVENTVVQRKEVSADARELVSMLRNPQNVRRAVLASIVLGPPKAAEM